MISDHCHPIGETYNARHPRYFNRHCFYCGVRLKNPSKAPKGVPLQNAPHTRSLDHVEPRSLGNGKSRNCVPACRQCNHHKSSLSLENWRIVFFGGHGGLFFGEKIERDLLLGVFPAALVGPDKSS